MKYLSQNKQRSERNYPKEEKRSHRSAYEVRPWQDRRFARKVFVSEYEISATEEAKILSDVQGARLDREAAGYIYTNQEEGENHYNRAI